MSQVTSTASRVGGNNVRQLGRAVSHFACVEVVWPQWEPILDNLATLISDLHKSAEGRVTLPYGSTLDVQEAFERESSSNQPALAALLVEVHDWVRQTLTVHECLSVLGL